MRTKLDGATLFGRRKLALPSGRGVVRLTIADVSYANVEGFVQEIRAAAFRIDTAFDLPSSPDVAALAEMVSADLDIPAYEPRVNVIGALMAESTQQLLSEHLPDAICAPFRLFLTSATLIRAQVSGIEIPVVGPQALSDLRDWSSGELLRQLEGQLVPKHLTARSLQSLTALYLVVLGTIMAAGCACTSPSQEICIAGRALPVDNDRSSLTETVRVLAQHLTFLGSKTSILKTEKALKTLCDHAECAFHLVQEVVAPHAEGEDLDYSVHEPIHAADGPSDQRRLDAIQCAGYDVLQVSQRARCSPSRPDYDRHKFTAFATCPIAHALDALRGRRESCTTPPPCSAPPRKDRFAAYTLSYTTRRAWDNAEKEMWSCMATFDTACTALFPTQSQLQRHFTGMHAPGYARWRRRRRCAVEDNAAAQRLAAEANDVDLPAG